MELNNLKDVKFFIGPMSKNIVDTIIDFSEKENYKIGIIASRRQIDYDGGYCNGWNTETFIDYVSNKKNIIIQRDHGGIGQGKYFDNGTLSLYTDSKKFNIIHIDPWHHYNRDFKNAINETVDNIKFINKLNDNCLFEIGTEESIYYFDEEMLNNMLKILKNKLGELFNKITYCVIQSGTKLKGTKNIGEYDPNRLSNMVKICQDYNILSKDHNCDYLPLTTIKHKFEIGLSAINIAPEFGVFETDILLNNMSEEQKEEFFNICYNSNKWVKWVDKNFEPFKNKIDLMRICGHYQFSTEEFKNLNLKFDNIIKEKLYSKIKTMINYEQS